MSAATSKSKLSFPPAFYVLGGVMLIGLAMGIYRISTSLGAATGLNNGVPWGLWIVFDFFTVPLSAGAFTLAATLHIFNRKEYHAIAHLALLAGWVGYLLVVLVLVLDINRWDQFYNVLLPNLWNLHSFMFEVAMSITLYFGVMVLELLPIVFGRKNWVAVQLVERLIPLIAGVGVLLSTVHQSSIGAIYLILRHRLHPLWWSPIIPLLFLTSALFSGLSVATLLSILTWRALRKPPPKPLLTGLAKVAGVIMAVYLALKVGDLLFAGDLGLLFGGGGAVSLLLWLELILVVVAMVIYLSRAREKENTLLAGAICALAAIVLNRASIAWLAFSPTSGYTYRPTIIEIGILVAALCAGALFYSLGVRHIASLREGVEGAHH